MRHVMLRRTVKVARRHSIPFVRYILITNICLGHFGSLDFSPRAPPGPLAMTILCRHTATVHHPRGTPSEFAYGPQIQGQVVSRIGWVYYSGSSSPTPYDVPDPPFLPT